MLENPAIHKEYLYPAKIIISRKPMMVSTVLGSCVAVCLYDPATGIGGMNHYMLPLWNGQGLETPKYGNVAIDKLLEKMLHYGAHRASLVAKIFGGAASLEGGTGQFNIGERNISIGLRMLDEYKVRVTARHLGGNRGRHVQFNTATGEVLMRMVQNKIIDIKRQA